MFLGSLEKMLLVTFRYGTIAPKLQYSKEHIKVCDSCLYVLFLCDYFTIFFFFSFFIIN
jgi:hypothetical protein